MKRLCWFISMVLLLLGQNAIAEIDLLNLSAYPIGTVLPYGENVIVAQDDETGSKWLTAEEGQEGYLRYPVSLSSDFEILIKIKGDDACCSHAKTLLFTGDEHNIKLSFGYSAPKLQADSNYTDADESKAWKSKQTNFLRLSVTNNIARLYVNYLFSQKLALESNLSYTQLLFQGLKNDVQLYELKLGASSDSGTVPSSPTKLINISTRASIQGGANDVIAGFIIQGTTSQQVIIRGLALEPGVDPKVTLQQFPGGEFIASNNDWQTQTLPSFSIPAQFSPPNITDAALLLILQAGAYTVILSSLGAKGLGLISVDTVD
ncbi:MAG: hypothetical protein VSS75_007990 [Candidatus Parabeggiatoa sp.]|nr:hypothetical protein [Candidatus Parabeggiatoa sp.]